jgi:hypothetical protein
MFGLGCKRTKRPIHRSGVSAERRKLKKENRILSPKLPHHFVNVVIPLVPRGLPTIARHFNAGNAVKRSSPAGTVEKGGRLQSFPRDLRRRGLDPALKCRAIVTCSCGTKELLIKITK